MAVSGSLEIVWENMSITYTNIFFNLWAMRHGRRVVPTRSGYSIEMKSESLADHGFPRGKVCR